jgi:hypothetical protein
MQQRWLPLFLVGLALFALVSARQYLVWRDADSGLRARMIGEAPRLLEALPEAEYPRALMDWFQQMTRAGHAEDAQRMAGALERPKAQSHALSAVAHGLFERQEVAQARKVAEAIPDPLLRDQTLRVVSIGFALVGKTQESNILAEFVPSASGRAAVETAAAVKDPAQRSQGLADTAGLLELMRDPRNSADAADRITDPSARARVESQKAFYLALRQQSRAAVRTAEAIEDPLHQVHALGSVADRLADRGDPDQAVAAAERAEAVAGNSPALRDGARATLAQVLAKVGRFDRARTVAATIGEESLRNHTVEELVEIFAKQGHVTQALELARSLPDPVARSSALYRLVFTSKRGIEAVRAAGDEILALATAVFDPEPRSEQLIYAAQALAQAGMAETAILAAGQAEAAAGRIESPERRADALAQAALALARVSQGKSAAEAARRTIERTAASGPRLDTVLMLNAAEALAKAVPGGEAVATLTAIPDPRTRALALRALAEALVESRVEALDGDAAAAAARALDAAQSVADPLARAQTLGLVMNVAARAGHEAEATAAAELIPDSLAADRSVALREVAAALAQQQQYEGAWRTAQGCMPADKLTAYAAIMGAFAHKEWRQSGRRPRGPR